ncbi:hypothetical protein HYV91_00355 [Candidatus Wolfebacteria bacterium]|nr:hypothetical protein [Candidatus Wolfebacteria bacterium]
MFEELYHKFPEEVTKNIENKDRLKPPVDLTYLESLVEGNELLENLLKEMLDYCLRYTETALRFQKALEELDNPAKAKERAELDLETKTVHDATNDSINIFSRELAKAGRDNSWVADISSHRAAYAKFVFSFVFYELAKAVNQHREEVD